MSQEENIVAQSIALQYKRMFAIYWTSLIPIITGQYILDRLLSIIFNSNYVPFERAYPYFPIWIGFSFIFFAFPFSLFYIWWVVNPYYFKKSIVFLLRAAMVVPTIASICVVGYFIEQPYLTTHGQTFWGFFPILWALSIALGPGTFVLCVLAKKLVSRIILVLAYVAVFAIIHWFFYIPMYPNFTWMGTNTTWDFRTDPTFIFIMILIILSFITIILMIVFGSERIRNKLVMNEVNELKRWKSRKNKV